MQKYLIAIKYSLLSFKIAETVRHRIYPRPQILRSHQQLYMNEVVFGTGFGVLLGPHVLNIFDPRSWTSVTNLLTREVMRIVLAIGLFAIGVRLPTKYMAEHAKSLLIMVVPTMTFGWLISAGKSPAPL
jgi:NhaP-type Na+/H+ or K+/H+ antiporter